MSTRSQHMTEREWQQVLPLLRRFKPTRLAAAHLVLVRGETLTRAGEVYGLHKQAVDDVVQRILERRLVLAEVDEATHTGVRPGWVRLTFDVPQRRAKYVRQFATSVSLGMPLHEVLEQLTSDVSKKTPS